MTNIITKIFSDFCKRGDKKAADVNDVEQIENARKYAKSLYAYICDSYDVIAKMMKSCGLTYLEDDGKPIPELDKYPELKKIFFERKAKRVELEKFLQVHPELWEPIEDDVSLYYDSDKVRGQIANLQNKDNEYIRGLETRIGELKQKLGIILDVNALLRDRDKVLDVAPSQEEADLMNEMFYLTELYLDAIATIGDEQDKILWDAVPKVIKDKYVEFVNNKMVEILASDDELTQWVKDFNPKQTDPDTHERFRWHLERKLNTELFNKVERPVSIELYMNKYSPVGGSYIDAYNIVKFNTAKWGHEFSDTCTVDEVVGTIKHEILGHYANNNFPFMGLYGQNMKDFMKQHQKYTHADLIAAGRNTALIAKSPLLHEEYSIPCLPPVEIQNKMWAQGWQLGYSVLKDDFDLYQNTFEERSAWLLSPTKDISGEIDRYRAVHGLKPIVKTR